MSAYGRTTQKEKNKRSPMDEQQKQQNDVFVHGRTHRFIATMIALQQGACGRSYSLPRRWHHHLSRYRLCQSCPSQYKER